MKDSKEKPASIIVQSNDVRESNGFMKHDDEMFTSSSKEDGKTPIETQYFKLKKSLVIPKQRPSTSDK